MFRIFALTALLASVGATAALAEHHGDKHGKKGKDHKAYYEKIDANGDGMISRDEFVKNATERMDKRFSALDADGDGMVSKDEMKKGHAKMKEKMKKHWGKDGKKYGDKHDKDRGRDYDDKHDHMIGGDGEE